MNDRNTGNTAWWAAAVAVALLCCGVNTWAGGPSGGVPAQEEVVLVDPGSLPGDQYGHSVAIDGTTMLVGSPTATSTDDGSVGLVLVYIWNGHAMEQVAELSLGPGDLLAEFGTSVAVDGDTIVVGAPNSASGSGRAGKIYIYSISGETLSLEAELASSSALDNGDRFGASVAISGDNVLAGAPNDSIDESNQGSVTTFDGSSGAWVEDTVLQSLIPVADAGFGTSVAFDGSRAAIGEPGGTSSAGQSDVGAVDVFQHDPGNWIHETRLDAIESGIGSLFGSAVDIDDSLVAIGAPENNSGSGHVTVYLNSSPGVWSPVNLVLPKDLAIGDGLGTSIGLSGSTVYAGAPLGTGLGSDTGCVHVFTTVGGSYEETNRLVASFLSGSDQAAVGWSLDVSDTDVIVGGPDYDGSIGMALFFGDYSYWTAAESGDWFNPANWTSNEIPDASTPVLFSILGSTDVSIDKAAMCASMDVYDGNLTFLFDEFGGTLEVEGNNGMVIGSTGSASLSTSSGSIDLLSSLQIGLEDGVNGSLDVNGTVFDVQDSIAVGVNGTGQLHLLSDATMLGYNMTVGSASSSSVTLSGTSSLILLPQNAMSSVSKFSQDKSSSMVEMHNSQQARQACWSKPAARWVVLAWYQATS